MGREFDWQKLARDIHRFRNDRRLSLNEICKAAHTSQPLAWRALNGQTRKFTAACEALCRYANLNREDYLVLPDPSKNGDLMGALQDVWDGTDRHARNIARLIRLLPKCQQTRGP